MSGLLQVEPESRVGTAMLLEVEVGVGVGVGVEVEPELKAEMMKPGLPQQKWETPV